MHGVPLPTMALMTNLEGPVLPANPSTAPGDQGSSQHGRATQMANLGDWTHSKEENAVHL